MEPSVDLLASHNNCKAATYASLKPDPLCTNVDAFTLTGLSSSVSIYFPPLAYGDELSETENLQGTSNSNIFNLASTVLVPSSDMDGTAATFSSSACSVSS